MAIVMDLETVAVDGLEIEPVSAPANYKDPEKIAAYIADAERAQRDRAALYPWSARVVCLGWIDEDGTEVVMSCADEGEERATLKLFWKDVIHEDARFVRPIIGFHSRQFDLPVLMARSLLLDMDAPALNLDRYRSPHIDLMDKLTWHGAVQARSLHWYAKRLSIPVEDTIKGGDIAGLVAAGDWASVEAHCRSDIRLTQAVAQRLGYLRGGKAVAA